ncbi:MAG: DNA repair protein RecO [Verrucomicrobiae bacterium]|nr:DNA repair protein RecO [Verrucomicrobiae bacterium]
MKLERAEGVVLRHHPLTESSLIVHWLTREHGRLRTVARGALRPKSAFRGKLDVFFRAEFTFARSARSELHTLRELALHETHPVLRRDFDRLRLAAYAARLIEQNTEGDTPVPDIYGLFGELLGELAVGDPPPALVAAFELCLLTELGLGPGPRSHRLRPESQAWMGRLGRRPLDARTARTCPRAALSELNHFLHGFLIHHLGRVPKGRPAFGTAAAPAGDEKNIEGTPGMTAE